MYADGPRLPQHVLPMPLGPPFSVQLSYAVCSRNPHCLHLPHYVVVWWIIFSDHAFEVREGKHTCWQLVLSLTFYDGDLHLRIRHEILVRGIIIQERELFSYALQGCTRFFVFIFILKFLTIRWRW